MIIFLIQNQASNNNAWNLTDIITLAGIILASIFSAVSLYQIKKQQKRQDTQFNKQQELNINLNLFEKRLGIYNKVLDIFTIAATNRNYDKPDILKHCITDLKKCIIEAQFLFNKETYEFLNQWDTNLFTLCQFVDRYESYLYAQRIEDAEELGEKKENILTELFSFNDKGELAKHFPELKINIH